MSVIAKVVVPAVDFPSNGRLAADGGGSVELERVLDSGGQPIPYFWLEGAQSGSHVTELASDGDVADAVVVDEIEDGSLVRIELAPECESLFHGLTDTGGTVLQAERVEDAWVLQLEFDEHEMFVEFYRWCIELDIGIDIDHVHDLSDTRRTGFEFALTPTQRDTLLTAFHRGYFDVPREINLLGLAEEFDISDTAVSQRLRRGIRTLVAATLAESSGPTDE